MGGSQRHVQDKSYFVGILRAKMAELTTEIKNIQVRKPLLLFFSCPILLSSVTPRGALLCHTVPFVCLGLLQSTSVLHRRLSL